MLNYQRFEQYALAHREDYVQAAQAITPDLVDGEAVRGRMAFAILSANVGFNEAVKAYQHVRDAGGCHMADYQVLRKLGGFRKLQVRAVHSLAGQHEELLRKPNESWHDYRCRIAYDVAGLGLCKASFAVSLLYPLESNVACLDTWMRTLWPSMPKQEHHNPARPYEIARYLRCERQLAAFATRYSLPSVFLAQWIIWDALRDGSLNAHNFWEK
jgi:hypothetical protein